MFEFFMWLKTIPDAMQKLFSGFRSTFIFGVIRYWYYLMTIPAIYAVYALLKALETSGIMDKFKAIVVGMLATINHITVNCFPLIANLKAMIACINVS
jgi:hypothetical protein